MESGDVPVESVKDYGGDDKESLARRWQTEIRLALKEHKPWLDKVAKITKRYMDQRIDDGSGGGTAIERARRLNILWSNIQTLMPALYAKEPIPVAERRFSDSDPIARTASIIIERAIQTDHVLTNLDAEARKCVLDYLIGGRGVLWVLYEETKGDVPVPGFEDQTYEGFVEQHTPALFVNSDDFLHSPSRCWEEVRWVARRAFMTRDEMKNRFGDKIGAEVPLDYTPKHVDDTARSTPEYEAFKKAAVWEIWDKASKRVIWISMAFKDDVLDMRDDPMGLREFFPCPRPCYGTLNNNSLIPQPDYELYRDQAEQIDDMTARIAMITEAIRAGGVYAGEKKMEIEALVQSGGDNMLVPVEDWVAWAEKSGLKGLIDWMPTEPYAKVLAMLFDARERVKKDLWEVTGLSDLFRGQTVASETATAQRLKGQFASLRIQDRQADVKRLLRDVVRIQAEIIAEKFAPNVIKEMSGIAAAQGVPPDTIDPAIQLLQSDDMRNWKINIETDETSIRDPDMEKQSAIEFVTAFGGFLQNALPLAQTAPMVVPLIGELAKFLTQKFRAARPLEATIEQMLPQLQQQADQQRGMQDQAQQQALQQGAMPEPGEAPPDPQMGQAEMVRASAEAEATKTDSMIKQQELGLKTVQTRADIANANREQNRKDQESKFKQQIEGARLIGDRNRQMADMQNNVTKLNIQQQQARQRAQQQAMKPPSGGGRPV